MYDMIPLEAIKLLPQTVISALAVRQYEYIMVEAGKYAKYTSGFTCSQCKVLASTEEFVKLNPTAKPTRGYVWECSSCVKKALIASGEMMEEDFIATTGTKVTPISSPSVQAACSPSLPPPAPIANPVFTVKPIWPYRYINEGFSIAELDDPLDLGNPRGTSRIGKQFQADVPDGPIGFESATSITDEMEQLDEKERRSYAGRPQKRKKQPEEELFIRGGQDEVVFDFPESASNDELEKFTRRIEATLPKNSIVVDALDIAFHELHKANYDFETAFTAFCNIPTAKYMAHWTPSEVNRFEASVRENGSELHSVYLDTRTKSSTEVVKFFYIWKSTEKAANIKNIGEVESASCSSESEFPSSSDGDDLDGEKRHSQKNSPTSATSSVTSGILKSITPPNSDRLQSAKISSSSIVPAKRGARTLLPAAHDCANCFTSVSESWIRGSRESGAKNAVWYCGSCGDYWKKYSYMLYVSESMKRANREKLEVLNGGGDSEKRRVKPKKKVCVYVFVNSVFVDSLV
ncbi:UNVERIFIED_CONTAM: putative PHD type zinc finger protein with BAH domain-containing protein [Siphonaria sp. JEL0065]|nr:putative PHD type zinc finger protein with BAH domain-containing protein [Siphonaria sp. JEL0065]